MPRPPARACLALSAALGAAGFAAAPAAAAGAPFSCEASVLRGSVLVAPPIEPLVANRGQACTTSSAGLPNLSGPLPLVGAGALTALTQRTGPDDRSDLQQNVAAAAVSDLTVGSLASLGLALPLETLPLPEALQAQTIDISALTGPLNGVTAPVGGTVGGIIGGLPLPLPLPIPLPLPVPGLTLPDKITVDISAAVRELVQLPTTDVLSVKSAVALAGAQCVGGQPVTSGLRDVTGVSVLGTALDVETLADAPILDTQQISLGQLNPDLVKVPVVEGLLPVLVPTLKQLVLDTLKALPPIPLPIELARVQVTPGAQIRTATALTQTALAIKVTALGQPAVDLLLGEAKVGTAGVDCTPPAGVKPPATPAPPAVTAPVAAAQAPLACTTRRLVLTDVIRRGGRVTITGVADRRLAGRFVTIRFDANRSTAGRALVAADGTFRTTAPLPARRLRSGNRARYQAVLGAEKSLNLKLERRMLVDRLDASGGRVTVAGRVTRPLGRPAQTITLTRRVSCRDTEVVKRFKPRADGRFSVTVPAPQGQTSAVYRLGTKVRKSVTSRKLFPTFTLPQGVDLTR